VIPFNLNRVSWLLLGFAVAAVPTIAIAPGAIRVVVAALLVCVAPGYAIVRMLGLPDAAVVAVSSVAASLAVTTLVSMILGYLSVWSWAGCAACLAAITGATALAPNEEVET
jgi:uncharacterized membrane protein